jgi:nitrogen fixation NifU-like protein
MTDALYRAHLLEHWKNPQNFGVLTNPTHHAEKNNPLCGDEIRMTARITDGRVADIAFDGRGCAVSIAAASLLTEHVRGMTVAEIAALSQKTVTDLLGVVPSPARMKCAVLALETLRVACSERP